MRFPWANTLLLLLITLQVVTGYLGFTSGRETERWQLWLHGIGAYAIVLALFWKGAIVLEVYRRSGRWTARRLAFAFMAVLLFVTLLTGLLWTFYGPLYFQGFSYVTIHIFLAVLFVALVVWHVIAYRWILKNRQVRDRRAFFRATTLGAAGLALWVLNVQVKRALALPGAGRRFTGSYEIGSFGPHFPQVSWINDDPAPINLTDWQLTIAGAVQRPLVLSYDQLIGLSDTGRDAILDCTGGWYSEQQWMGIRFAAILALVSPETEARSVSFESITGYDRRFSLPESQGFLLATHVAGAPLSHGHGFPMRLVIPGRRGVHWVKWLTQIRFNTTSHHLQPPLPLQ
ncbi:MAG TPA: molybdopterin-dependent oxidoreductase [Anaerolineae bacterium]|jgi:DMSO/TMAO reductase YedYZ molybdopterin-dependent catalytic subunit|nr:molybdopterin-dependent oxidoreductase [Anaerolineae bacterium]